MNSVSAVVKSQYESVNVIRFNYREIWLVSQLVDSLIDSLIHQFFKVIHNLLFISHTYSLTCALAAILSWTWVSLLYRITTQISQRSSQLYTVSNLQPSQWLVDSQLLVFKPGESTSAGFPDFLAVKMSSQVAIVSLPPHWRDVRDWSMEKRQSYTVRHANSFLT